MFPRFNLAAARTRPATRSTREIPLKSCNFGAQVLQLHKICECPDQASASSRGLGGPAIGELPHQGLEPALSAERGLCQIPSGFRDAGIDE